MAEELSKQMPTSLMLDIAENNENDTTQTTKDSPKEVPLSTILSMNIPSFQQNRHNKETMSQLPSQFFEKYNTDRAQTITIVDPLVQPIPKNAVIPQPFHVTLPGYTEKQCSGVMNYKAANGNKENNGPDISNLPTWFPKFSPDPYFKAQEMGYNFEDQESFKMDKFSYVNAYFQPRNPMETLMYNQMNPWTAYPYGVPAIDEYEQIESSPFCCSKVFF